MKATVTILSATALLALAACSKPSTNDASVGTAMDANEIAEKVDAVKLEPGEWEATTEVIDAQVSGLPQGVPADAMTRMIGQRSTFKHCITPEQAAKPSADFMAGQKDANCNATKFEMTGGKVEAEMSCAVPQQEKASMKIAMTGTYMPDRYDMDMTVDTANLGNGLSMTMKMKNSGKRLGECVGSSDAAPEDAGN